MNQPCKMVGFVLLLMAINTCDDSRPDVLKSLLLGNSGDWLTRDPTEDPYEWKDGQCCNDTRPATLPLDSAAVAAINPADDLDYYDLADTTGGLGLLRLASVDPSLGLRIFSQIEAGAYREEKIGLDSVNAAGFFHGMTNTVDFQQWTYLLNIRDYQFIRTLIQGEKADLPALYALAWTKIIPTVGLDLLEPGSPVTWQRGDTQKISWRSKFTGGVTVTLMNELHVIEVLKRDVDSANQVNWSPDGDLPAGKYRILIYLADDPTVAEVSDDITIK